MQYPNHIDTKKFGFPASFGPMARAGTSRLEDVAMRCRALTEMYGEGVSQKFAEEFGLGVTQWNNIEQSGNLSKPVAFQIVRRRPAVSLDWLWLGSERGLTPTQADEFSKKFQEALAKKKKEGRRAG